jgi:excinuclease ABC subunit B
VAVLDADQEGFLRSERSLIQTIGRAARHQNGRAIFYANRITGSMQRAIDETSRRREAQRSHNETHGITPASVVKSIEEVRFSTRVADAREPAEDRRKVAERGARYDPQQVEKLVAELEKEMRDAAKNLDFETAARLRDEVFDIRAASSGTKPAGRGWRSRAAR